jgi:two-component system, NtrC family, response regulator GlrR
METDISWGVPSHRNQSVLILNQNSSPCPCAANKCDALLGLLQRSLAINCIQERCDNQLLLHRVSSVPDLILMRPSIGEAAQELIETCKEKWDRVAILALLCPGSEDVATDFSLVLNSVDDFLFCPFRDIDMIIRVKRLLQSRKRTSVSTGTQHTKGTYCFVPIVGESPCFLRVIAKIPLLADCDTTVLISGETGSGKEIIARAIHYQGPRQGKPFIPVNCGALPDHLFENELFGHAKGAFTDASSAEKGLIGEAEGGTLFLDEIDALSQTGQVKLLRFLQNGEYRAIGSSRSLVADVRVLAATNSDLMQRVKDKSFREDLYYRLNALSLVIPPLRNRVEDIMPLTTYFLSRYASEHSQQTRRISHAALERLMAYAWPGNVRELESVIRGTLVLTAAETIQVEDIDLPLSYPKEGTHAGSLSETKSLTIHAFERAYLTNLLVAHRGNVSQAAKASGKDRRALQRLLRKYSLDRSSFLNLILSTHFPLFLANAISLS